MSVLDKNVEKVMALTELRGIVPCTPNSRLDNHLGFLIENVGKIMPGEKPLKELGKRIKQFEGRERQRQVLRLSLLALKKRISGFGTRFQNLKQLCEREEKQLQETSYPSHENQVIILADEFLPEWYRLAKPAYPHYEKFLREWA